MFDERATVAKHAHGEKHLAHTRCFDEKSAPIEKKKKKQESDGFELVTAVGFLKGSIAIANITSKPTTLRIENVRWALHRYPFR